jgi:hypothetical protein
MTEHTDDQTIRCALLQMMESKWFDFSARPRPSLVDARLVRILFVASSFSSVDSAITIASLGRE